MTIREALDELLAGSGGDLDPAAVLDGYGFDDLSPDALSTALGHFVDRAPLDVADALAPLITRLSDVPFVDGDLPPAPEVEAALAEGALFDALGAIEVSPDGVETDPTDFDASDDVLDRIDTEVDVELDGGIVDDALGTDFGHGTDDPNVNDQAEDPTPDPIEALDVVQSVADEALFTDLDGAPMPDEVDLLEDLGDRFDDDVDPGDLDFDLG